MKPQSAEDIRAFDRPIVAFSGRMEACQRELKAFLFERMYRHPRVKAMTMHAANVVRDLFRRYVAEPTLLPERWRVEGGAGGAKGARAIADYIAGMTDTYALEEHRRLFARAGSS